MMRLIFTSVYESLDNRHLYEYEFIITSNQYIINEIYRVEALVSSIRLLCIRESVQSKYRFRSIFK